MAKRRYRYVWALYDSAGELAGTYPTSDEAQADAYGPRFRKGFDVRRVRIANDDGEG